ncbi:hypothetical protein [Salinigranum halophilum]|jgi:hypothetical protein|uniref:hypothetical protein n=1 Tax=Salinigranum halophilum TaxID=2565931 RepID=UPI00191BDE14|nr:hypothetical protein [Salinigranum halophilum]
MPDTKSGREKKGLNKLNQLDERLNERELRTLDRDDEPPRWADVDGEFIADEAPDDD